jgi:hypothetical protein
METEKRQTDKKRRKQVKKREENHESATKYTEMERGKRLRTKREYKQI